MKHLKVVGGKLRAPCPLCQPEEHDSGRWRVCVDDASNGLALLTCSACGVVEVVAFARLGIVHATTEAERSDNVERAPGDGRPAAGDTNDSETIIADGAKIHADQSRPELPFGYSGLELLQTDFPPPRWAVPSLVPQGLTILAGRPKTGKSWLTLGWAMAVAQGTLTMGSISVTAGDTLLLAMEDTWARLQRRENRLLGKASRSGLERLHAYTAASDWPRLHEGGLETLRIWLDAHPNARLVVLDTFACCGPPIARRKQDKVTIEVIDKLKEFADAHAVAIVLVDHETKGNNDDPVYGVAGSHGYTARADAVLVLRRERQADVATLHVTGRDIEEQAYPLLWDLSQGGWLLDDAKCPGAQTPAEWLRNYLADGERPAEEILAAAKEMGWSKDKIKRARGQLGTVITEKKGHGWWWRLRRVGTEIKKASTDTPAAQSA
jgi:hypothetical protein